MLLYLILNNLVLWASGSLSLGLGEPRLSRIAGVRDPRLCLGVWCVKSQIPSTKLQI